MKKFGIATLALGLVLSASAYAADISASGTVVQSLQTGGKTADTAAYGFGKSRITLNLKADDKVSVTYIAKVESNLDADYIFADIKTDLGLLRVGTIYECHANYGGGIYQTNTLLGLTVSKGTGIGFYTKYDKYNIGIFNITAPLAQNATKVYGAKVDTSYGDLTVGAVAKTAVNDDNNGASIEVEGSYKIGAGKVSAQYYMDLNDNGAVLMPSLATVVNNVQLATKKRSYLGIFGEYNVGYGVGVYGDYVMALNDDTKTAWQDNQLKAGASYALNAKSTLYAELQSNTEKDADAVYTSSLGLQVKF